MQIENECKKIFGKKGYLTKEEMPDGFTETIKYSKENLKKIMEVVGSIIKK